MAGQDISSETVRRVPGPDRPFQALPPQSENPENLFVLIVVSATGVNAGGTQVYAIVAGIGDIRPVTARDVDM